jgi:hypothetical protein
MKITPTHARNRIFSDYQVQKYADISADYPSPPWNDSVSAGAVAAVTPDAAESGWDGVERRRTSDRRQQTRRQYRAVSMLDTRTEADRRRNGRRQSDRLRNGFVACKV